MENTLEQLLLRGQQGAAGSAQQNLLSAHEAERVVEQLQALSIEEVGSAKWHTQHEVIEKLNLQAHHNAQVHSDEFVVESLVSYNKMDVLVHDLLVIEAWKQFVLPHLLKHLATSVDPVLSYLLMYHEAAVANLLEVTMYHSHACEALSEDFLLELADWCYRKLQYLNTDAAKDAAAKERSASSMMAQTKEEELLEKKAETDFGVAMCALTILRYLTDNVTSLSLGLLSRLTATNDTIMGLVPLLEKPPWVRMSAPRAAAAAAAKGGATAATAESKPSVPSKAKGGGSVLEKFIGNRWQAVTPSERFKLVQPDVQVWLALNNLLVEPRCRAKYPLDEWRKERVLGLKRHMHELLFDQLPPLKDLQRCLDEIALNVGGPDAGMAKSAGLILEQVPTVRENILAGRQWQAVAIAQAKDAFGPSSKALARSKMEGLLKAFEFMAEMQEAGGNGAAANGSSSNGAAANGNGSLLAAEALSLPVKVATFRKVGGAGSGAAGSSGTGGGFWEPWTDVQLQLDPEKPPERVQLAAPEGGAAALTGIRYRLLPMAVANTRPFPTSGKASVRHGSFSAEALLSLPEVAVKSAAADAPPGLWVTIGLLATDGLALQLKLKRTDEPLERDKIGGGWYTYHPVGGALTLLAPEA